eukprot:522099_1
MAILHILVTNIVLFQRANSQYTTIWSDNCQNMYNSRGWFDWTPASICGNTCSSLGCYCSMAMNSRCPHGSSVSDFCLGLRNTAYVQRTTNIASYSSIRLQFDFSSRDSCNVQYKYDTVNWTNAWAGDGSTGNDVITFPSDPQASTISIRLHANGDALDFQCFWDDITLSGSSTTYPPQTDIPSISSSGNPTHLPTEFPSHDPSVFPTIFPTVTPTHLSTKYPSHDPTVAQTELTREISITVTCAETECHFDNDTAVHINNIIIPYLDENTGIIGTKITGDTISIIIATADSVPLDKDTITNDIKRELKDLYDAEVDVTYDDNTDESYPDDANNDISTGLVIGLIIGSTIFLIVIITGCTYVCGWWGKKKQAQMHETMHMIRNEETDGQKGSKQTETQDTQADKPPGTIDIASNRDVKGCDDQNDPVVILDKGSESDHSLVVTSEGPSHIAPNMIEMGDASKAENEPGEEDNRNSDSFDNMFVDQNSVSLSKQDQNKVLHQGTIETPDDQKISFHGTKGNYYDEYNHKMYRKRNKHQDK